jgi:membrane protease YdiL (CAAX protease family)
MALSFFALTIVAGQFPRLCVWPWLWVVPFGGYGCLVALIPGLRRTFKVWRFGTVTRSAVAATAFTSLGACGVLVAFDRLHRPDVSSYAYFLRVPQLGGIAIAGVLFTLFNALFEEIAFRGLLFDAVESQSGRATAIIITAVIFGVCHIQGYPPGLVGAVLAGVFGAALGWLRAKTGGLGLPVVAHILADATIYCLIARTGVWGGSI